MTLMIRNLPSALKSARLRHRRQPFARRLSGFIRLEKSRVLEERSARRADASAPPWIGLSLDCGEEPVVFESNYVRDFECSAVPGSGC